MLKVLESDKSVDQVVKELEAAVPRHGFGVLHMYDLKAKMAEKGVDFPNECRILEVCNPQIASQVLSQDMTISLALPCRIAVYEENGKTKIGTILPKALLSLFPNATGAEEAAKGAEQAILAIMDEAS